jgi:hypothetical protein
MGHRPRISESRAPTGWFVAVVRPFDRATGYGSRSFGCVTKRQSRSPTWRTPVATLKATGVACAKASPYTVRIGQTLSREQATSSSRADSSTGSGALSVGREGGAPSGRVVIARLDAARELPPVVRGHDQLESLGVLRGSERDGAVEGSHLGTLVARVGACTSSAGSPCPSDDRHARLAYGSPPGECALRSFTKECGEPRPRVPRTPTRGRVRLWPLPRPRPVKPRSPSVPGVRASTSWTCRTVPSLRGRGPSGRWRRR